MERRFIMKTLGRVIWIINSIVTFACLLAFVFTDGKELTLVLYIPLDIALNISKAAFFFWAFYQDRKVK